MPWAIAKSLRQIRKKKTIEEPGGLLREEGVYFLQEEFYWNANIILERKYAGKVFSRSQRYLISKIITSDNYSFSLEELAKRSNVSRRRMKNMLSIIRTKMEAQNE